MNDEQRFQQANTPEVKIPVTLGASDRKPDAQPDPRTAQLAVHLRRLRVPEFELLSARTHADALLKPVLMPFRGAAIPSARRKQARRIAIVACLAVLLLTLISSWQISLVAASAMPNSPLYAVKRAEERIALATAWSDERKADVLATIIAHRLNELATEERLGNMAVADQLIDEVQMTLSQLVAVALRLPETHAATSPVVRRVNEVLQQLQILAARSLSNGHTAIGAKLARITQYEQGVLAAHHVPSAGTPQHPSSSSHATPTPHPTPHHPATSPPPAVTPSHPVPGAGHGGSGTSGSNHTPCTTSGVPVKHCGTPTAAGGRGTSNRK